MMDRLGIEVGIGSISEPGLIPVANPDLAKNLLAVLMNSKQK